MIRIGIVGCGRILNAHLQGYRALRERGIDTFRITALCARREEDALMFARRGEGPPPRPPVLDPASGDPLAAPHTYLSDFQDDVEPAVYTDYRDLVTNGPVDAVNDLTTLAMHHAVGTLALQSGKHLLTQKPLAISVRAAESLVRLAAERGLTLGVFENVRQEQSVRAAAWAVRTGVIGQVQAAVIGSLGGPWSPDRVVADTPWRHQKLLGGGGGSIDIGVHQMHWLRYVVGEILAVSATARTFEPLRHRRDQDGRVMEEVRVDVDDTYLATASFEQGAIGQLLWSWGIHGEALSIPGTPALFGSEGSIRDGEVVLDDGQRWSLEPRFEQSLTDAERERLFPLGLRDPYAIQQLDWLRAIERGTDPETSGQEGLRDLACAFAILESSQLGRRITVREVLEHRVDAYQREIDEHYGFLWSHIDDLLDAKLDMLHRHTSQVYEWLPCNAGHLDRVPTAEEERRRWLRETFTPGFFASVADRCRDRLVELYGREHGALPISAQPRMALRMQTPDRSRSSLPSDRSRRPGPAGHFHSSSPAP